MSVGPGADIDLKESSGDTFFEEIGWGDRFSDSLYKTYWLSWRVNFLISTDESLETGSFYEIDIIAEF